MTATKYHGKQLVNTTIFDAIEMQINTDQFDGVRTTKFKRYRLNG